MTKHVNLMAAAFAAALVAACVAPSHIVTNKAQGYKSEPKRIFFVDAMTLDFGKDFNDGFNARLAAIARDCGAETKLSRVSSLELDGRARAESMKQFAPDAILTIRRTGGTKNEHGILLRATYDARLTDVQTNAVVWRADTSFARGLLALSMAERGDALAIELTNKMKDDQIFRSCAKIAPKG